ncbi:hypothetical protein ACOJQI_12300 [Bacillus salacetis]|uniref:hypothetical protein n=1 Tax=Bacillus salacetis TaxID=2315464 RepID=UPI003B9F47EB
MTDRLKNLKEDMDDTVLKDLDFGERHKAAVRRSFMEKQEKSQKTSPFRIGMILSLCFTTLFMGFAGYFVINNLQLAEQENLSSEELKEQVPVPSPEREESYADMTKEDVLHKIFNSVDYFDTASGQFENYYRYRDGTSTKWTVEYKISNNNVIGGYEKVINYPDPENPNSKKTISETYYNQNRIWNLRLDEYDYSTQEYEQEPKKQPVNPDDILKMDPDKIYDYESKGMYRESLPMMSAHSSLFGYKFAAKYLREENEWSIEKQNEDLLGHNTLVISGTLDESLVNIQQPDEKDFRIWVDKDTGIILKREVYDEEGGLVSYLHPSSLEINKTFDEEEFEVDLEGYQKRLERNLSLGEKESELQVIEHADTGSEEVEEVMAIQRETVPMFYEFNDSKIKPFSASIEAYQQDKHAYVVYSFDAPEEMGPESSLIYTRVYPRDTFLRKTGDFSRPLGEELDTLNVNGIHWSIFEIKGTNDVYLKGESGNFLFEMATYKVSFNEIKKLLSEFQKLN